MRSQGQADRGACAGAVFAVEEADFSAVGAGDLLRQGQAYTAAGRLSGVEQTKLNQ